MTLSPSRITGTVFDTPPSTSGTSSERRRHAAEIQPLVGERHRRLPAMRAEGTGSVGADKVVEQDGHWTIISVASIKTPISPPRIREGKPMQQHFRMFAAYNKWANSRDLRGGGRTVASDEFERNTGAFFKSMMGTLNHILVGRPHLDEALHRRRRRADSARRHHLPRFRQAAAGARRRGRAHRQMGRLACAQRISPGGSPIRP